MALVTSAGVNGVCPVCNVWNQACVGHTATGVTPVDDPIYTTVKESAMTDQPEEMGVYTYKVYGNEVQGQLSKADAERLGAEPYTEPDEDADPKAPTKARKAANKAVTSDDDK